MSDKHILKLHWKLFLPFIGLLWLIIGITIVHFVEHEKQRQKENLENRLLNVNNTVIDAYERGVDLQKTVDFIRLFIDNTTLAPLRITVYDSVGNMVADNPAVTIPFYDSNGEVNSEYNKLLKESGQQAVKDVVHNGEKSMISSKKSPDNKIYSFAALPYEGEVTDFLSIDPMVWIVVIALGLVSSVLAYFGAMAVCRNVYTLRDFARAVSSDNLPDDIDSLNFSKDELGDVSKNLLTLYRDKIHAEQEKWYYERQIVMNISHELNTPVGIVKGYIDTVLDSKDMPDELRNKFLLRAQQNTDRLTTIINDVSMVMRLQENKGMVKTSTINFHDMMVQLMEDVKQGHIADEMTFVLDVPDDCCVEGHESLLTNAMLNLIYNSAQHSGGTQISLRRLRREGELLLFSFADNGIGVDGEHRDRLFDLFYRVDYGRSRKNGGAGLGLPLVRRIINAMGGYIMVQDSATKGLEFVFALPATKVADGD